MILLDIYICTQNFYVVKLVVIEMLLVSELKNELCELRFGVYCKVQIIKVLINKDMAIGINVGNKIFT